MRRKRASDFPQELLDLFDGYVHGGISRRHFLDRAQKFAFGGVSAAALFQMLKRNYAWVMQIQVDDKRIKTEAAPSLPRHLRHVRAFGTPACSTNVHCPPRFAVYEAANLDSFAPRWDLVPTMLQANP